MVDFRALGPLEAVSDGLSLALGGARQRIFLPTLLLHTNGVLAPPETATRFGWSTARAL
jgi:DNA-binding SARP family transcriptional activator